jgi:hypothetical protein
VSAVRFLYIVTKGAGDPTAASVPLHLAVVSVRWTTPTEAVRLAEEVDKILTF